jgi:hypothetical protein
MSIIKDLKNSITDNLNSASIDVDLDDKVVALKEEFMTKFKVYLRVYHGSKFADDKAKLRDITKPGSDGKTFRTKGTDKVITVEDNFLKHFGIKVQVANKLNNALADNNKTIGQVSRGE